MNEQKAIDYATENGITVTTDKTTKHGKAVSVSFRVGQTIIYRNKGRRLWMVNGAPDL